jgi:ribosome-associated toxin RatA of RatAB toxin-antitoxin module
MMKDTVYTLDHKEDPGTGSVSWNLIQGDIMKKNSGRWELKSAGPGKTDVKYNVDIDFSIPVPGFILSRLVKGSLPSMVKGFVERAKT